MSTGAGHTSVMSGPAQPPHVVAGVVALLLSFAIHWVVLEVFPPLPVGKPADAAVTRDLKAVTLQGVHRQWEDATDRPEPFRPSDPSRLAESAVSAESQLALAPSAADEEQLNERPGDPVALLGEDSAVMVPEAEMERSDWQPSQEILMIQEGLFSEEVSASQRRLIPVSPRVDDAVDVAWPVQDAAATTMDDHRPGLGAMNVNLEGGVSTRLNSGAGGTLGVGTIPLEAEPKWEAATALIDETAEDVTDIEAVEELLDLDLHFYESPEEDAIYFRVDIQRKGAAGLPVLPKDILLIQDCSESMTSMKLNECKKGLHHWVDRLDSNDRFNIMGFREAPYLFSEEWSEVSPLSKSQARYFIQEMRSWGKTDVYASLKRVLKLERAAERPVVAVLVTDGRPTMGIVDSSDIIEGFTRANEGQLSVFAVGGGRRVNRFLLDLISFKNRGDSLVVRNRTDIPQALDSWSVQLGRPVLTHLTYHFAGVDDSEVYPRSLTYLYLDRPLVVYGRTTSRDKIAFQIVGRSGEKKHDMVFAMDFREGAKAGKELRRKWAWHRIYDLIGTHLKTQEPEILGMIQSVADQYGLIVPYKAELPMR